MNFLKDKEFFRIMLKIAIPITLQNLILSSLNMVDVLMIGKLGEAAIAGVGLGNQYFFVLNLLLFGIVSGTSIYTAQYWGNKDMKGIHRVMGISLISAGLASMVFMAFGIFMPEQILGIFSKDPRVIELGTDYLRIVAMSYPMTAVTFAYVFTLRGTGEVNLPMYASTIAFLTNTVLNYLLIYGKLGFPVWGVAGAAVATVIARVLEMVIVLAVTYYKKLPAASKWRELTDINFEFVKKFFNITIPVILNESMWGLGVTMYAIAYARMGTEAFASTNISGTIERIAWVFLMGVGNSCAVMIGNKIGEDDNEMAYEYAKRFIMMGVSISVLMGLTILLTAHWILMPFNVSDIVRTYSYNNLMVFVIFILVKTCNYIIVIGILRSGGDTKFCMFIDIAGVWFVGVPLAFLGALYFKLPIYYVYALVSLEEVLKIFVAIPRVLSKKWINNLTV